MDLQEYLTKVRKKGTELEERKVQHNKFVDTFFKAVGVGVCLSVNTNANAAEAVNYSQDNQDTQKVDTNVNTPLDCKVFNRVYEITYEECNRKHNVEDFIDHKNKAGYYPDYGHIVCETFHINDIEAYKIGNDGNADFDYALSAFKATLEKNKYQGKMPATLDDVRLVLHEGIKGLKEKQQEKIKTSASDNGLSQSLQIKDVVDKANDDHTSAKVVWHEYIHAKNAPILKKALLPSTLVSPKHLLMLKIADEIEAQLGGKTGVQDVVEAVKNIKRTNTTNYASNWQESVEAHRTEIQTYYPQNMSITEDGKLVDNFSEANYEQLLKEMIPDKRLRDAIKLGIEDLKNLKPNDHGYVQPTSVYNRLETNHNNFIKGLTVEQVKQEKELPYTDSDAILMAKKRNNKITEEYGAEHHTGLVDVSQNYSLDKDGKIVKSDKQNTQSGMSYFVPGFDYGKFNYSK